MGGHFALPVGYLVAIKTEIVQASSSWGKSFGPYLGVDRLPPYACPELEFWSLTGCSSAQVAKALMVLDTHFPEPKLSAFISDLQVVKTLLNEIDPDGRLFEILFCETLVLAEDSPPTYYQPVVLDKVKHACFYGYDVSWPTCNHSAIFQPAKARTRRIPSSDLNQFGLLSEFGQALDLRNLYLQEYPYPPFDVFRVHGFAI